MGPLVWDDATYAVGIAEIDRQHRRLFGLLSELYQAIQDGHAEHVIAGVLTKLVDYTVYHFTHEEQLLRLHGYPQAQAHRAEHERLTDQAKALAARLKSGRDDVTLPTLKFLCDWLSHHILGSDRKFAPFLLARGVR